MKTASRPALSDRHRAFLAAVEQHGSPSAAARALGTTPAAVSKAVGRAAVNLGTDTRGAVKAARAAGLLDNVPDELPAPPNVPAQRETVDRGDGTAWESPKGGSVLRVVVEGYSLLVLRTGDMEKARGTVRARWEGLHHTPVPATGQVVWRRLDPVRGGGNSMVVERCDSGAPRAFPAVLFTPEGA